MSSLQDLKHSRVTRISKGLYAKGNEVARKLQMPTTDTYELFGNMLSQPRIISHKKIKTKNGKKRLKIVFEQEFIL